MAASEHYRRWWVGLARFVVTGACLVGLWVAIEPAEFSGHLSRLTYGALATALALQAAVIFVLAWRWQSIGGVLGPRPSYGFALGLTSVTATLNLVLPLSLGGDVGRIVLSRRAGIDLATGITIAVLDRIIGLAALAVLSLLAVATLPSVALSMSMRGILLAVLPAIILLLCLFPMTACWANSRWRAIRSIAVIGEKSLRILRQPGLLLVTLIQSLIGHVLSVICAFAIARGLGLELTFSDALLLIPVVFLVAAVPISVGGWGVREAAAVTLLALSGIPETGALALSLILGLTQLAVSALGALLWLGYSATARRGLRA